MTKTTTTDRAQRLADAWRGYADQLSGCGAEIAALGYLRGIASATPRDVADTLTDVLAALDILSAERAARQEDGR